ncbi:MAG: carotenoid oxygenase family protein [Pseudoxanthomonas sp.]
MLAEEHVFVLRPGSGGAGDGWVVGTLLGARTQRRGIAMPDARRMRRSVGLAWLPYTVPPGFHGHRAAESGRSPG